MVKRKEKLQKYSRELVPSRRPLIHKYKRSLLLTDNEIFISLLKYMIAVGIFYRPKMMQEAGFYNAIISEFIGIATVILANGFLLKCLVYMPR